MKAGKTILRIHAMTLAAISVWIGLSFLAPYLRSESDRLNHVIYAIFSPVCHQVPSRCLYVFGFPMAVCARCFGIYTGFLAGVLLYPFLRGFKRLTIPDIRIFLCLSFPIVLDTAGNFASFWSTADWLRFIFGFLWGIVLPYYFITGIALAILQKRSKKTSLDQEFLLAEDRKSP
jgi:uncharacterized membrane protein